MFKPTTEQRKTATDHARGLDTAQQMAAASCLRRIEHLCKTAKGEQVDDLFGTLFKD